MDIQRHTNDTDAQSNGAESRPDDEDISEVNKTRSRFSDMALVTFLSLTQLDIRPL